MQIRKYSSCDCNQLRELWNSIVADGKYFPQDQPLEKQEAEDFFAAQNDTWCAKEKDAVLGFYILHPNGIGRRSHIANASYGVNEKARGKGIGKALVTHSLEQCKRMGYHGLQYNAVVDSNEKAMGLYLNLGFSHIGCIPGGFRLPEGSFADAHIFYKNTQK